MLNICRGLAGVSFVLFLQAGVTAQKGPAPLQGSYAVLNMVEGGVNLPAEEVKDMTVLWNDKQITVTKKKPGSKGADEIVAAFSIHLQSGKGPEAIDFTLTHGEEKSRKMLGIYRIEGDTVTFCFDEDGKVRPQEFISLPNSAVTLVVMKKIK